MNEITVFVPAMHAEKQQFLRLFEFSPSSKVFPCMLSFQLLKSSLNEGQVHLKPQFILKLLTSGPSGQSEDSFQATEQNQPTRIAVAQNVNKSSQSEASWLNM